MMNMMMNRVKKNDEEEGSLCGKELPCHGFKQKHEEDDDSDNDSGDNQ